MILRHPKPPLFPYTTLFRSFDEIREVRDKIRSALATRQVQRAPPSTRRIDVYEDNRSEEHTSELQSPVHLVCRHLLEKKKFWCGATVLSAVLRSEVPETSAC